MTEISKILEHIVQADNWRKLYNLNVMRPLKPGKANKLYRCCHRRVYCIINILAHLSFNKPTFFFSLCQPFSQINISDFGFISVVLVPVLNFLGFYFSCQYSG